MRNISHKPDSHRVAVAATSVSMPEFWVGQVRARALEKGDALEIARIAAISAAKKTSDLIPFCHQVALTHVAVSYRLEQDSIGIEVSVAAVAATGVEMEALTAAAICAITLYDILKPHTSDIAIGPTLLLSKTGGKDSEAWHDRPLRVSLRGATLDRAASWFGDLATLERAPEEGADLSVTLLPPDSRDEAPTGGDPDSGLELAMRQFAVRRLPAAAAWQLRASQCGPRTDLVVEEHGGITDQLLAAVAPALIRRVRSRPA
jgi:molybdenum cofactor biosynthesis protein MoaC